MKIIIRLEDNVVLYAGEDIRLDDTGAYGPVDETALDFAWHDASLNSLNAELVEVESLPDGWTGACFTYVDGVWVSTPEHQEQLDAQLTAARAARWEDIKTLRDRLQDEGGYKVDVDGAGTFKWFHSDVKSRTQQIGLVMMGASVPAVQWKTMDGSFVTMTQALASAVFNAAAQQDMSLFAHAEQLRAQVEAGDPAAVDIEAGWPETFAG